MIYSTAARRDIKGIAQVFRASFEPSILHVFGQIPDMKLIEQVFYLCYRAEPGGLMVAREGKEVQGYVFAPVTLRKLWRTALERGHLFRWMRNWVRGRYHVGLTPLKILLLDKFHFLRSAVGDEYAIDSRILSIAVSPRARGKKVGSRLLDHAMRRFERQGVARVRLEVRPNNVAARKIYEPAGFRVVSTTYDTQGPWLIMVTDLRTSDRFPQP